MHRHHAVALVVAAIGRSGGVRADLGGGTGTFMSALADLLAAGSGIYAVDRDARSVHALQPREPRDVEIVPARADRATTLVGNCSGIP